MQENCVKVRFLTHWMRFIWLSSERNMSIVWRSHTKVRNSISKGKVLVTELVRSLKICKVFQSNTSHKFG